MSYIGNWAREAGGQELMEFLANGKPEKADLVAQVVTWSNLPICLLSIFAGVLADVLDRRRFLVWTHLWIFIVSSSLAAMTFAGAITPIYLLILTALLGIGTALTGPAFQAIIPELVPPGDMPLAVALNAVALNIARAIGPVLFMLVVGLTVFLSSEGYKLQGVGLSFSLTAASFLGVIWVLWKWKRAPQRAAVHGEQMLSAMRAGIKFTIHSRAMRAILLRVAAFILCAVVVWAQFKLIAKFQLGLDTIGFAMLMAIMGLGAIVGVIQMPKLQRRFSIDKVVNVSTALFAIGLVLLSFSRSLWTAYPLMFFLGINWVVVPTNFNVATQKSVPAWVKGRAISMYLTFLFGSFSLGSAAWGRVSSLAAAWEGHPTIPDPTWSLLYAGCIMGAGLLLVKRYPLTLNDGLDLTPAYPKGTTPPVLSGAESLPLAGRVEMTCKYAVDPGIEPEFRRLMHEVGQLRKRNGASGWRLVRGKSSGHWTETTIYRSKAEFDRQPSRLTKADLKLQERASRYLAVSEPNPVSVRGENLWL